MSSSRTIVTVTAKRPPKRRFSVLCTLCSHRLTWMSSGTRTLDQVLRDHNEKKHPQLELPIRGGGR